MLGAAVWAIIATTCAIRIVAIWGSFFWQDDYIHIWTAWNAPASELVWQNWNGHREPLSFGVQWILARFAAQVWWPAAVLLSAVAVGTTVAFWLMLRRWRGTNPATASAAILFAAWPATLAAQTWLSAGLETVPLLLMLVAGWIMADPSRWTPAWVGVACHRSMGIPRTCRVLPAVPVRGGLDVQRPPGLGPPVDVDRAGGCDVGRPGFASRRLTARAHRRDEHPGGVVVRGTGFGHALGTGLVALRRAHGRAGQRRACGPWPCWRCG